MASRLDRLFTLLETGSSNVTRRAAANQLGEVQRLHPHELHNLLKSILSYLKSNSWETRLAAGWAVESVLKQVPEWCPIGIVDEDGESKVTDGESKGTIANNSGQLSCDTFNLNTVISDSAHLMASEGKEYETAALAGNSQEKLNKQRELLNSKLGLDAAAQFGMDTNSLYTIDDLKIEISTESQTKVNVGEVVGLSCREANRARRKARQAIMRSKKIASQQNDLEEEGEPSKKKIKIESQSFEENSYPVPDNTNCWPSDAIEWPLDWFCIQLTSSLFSPSWEVRHGAGTGIRHLMKTQGKCGGKTHDSPHSRMEVLHQSWLEDIALRLICVLTLDRFGDFVCDQVVAPVRETCAQALGSVIHLMEPNRIKRILVVLLKLLDQQDWETRHGGLLGIKYMFAVRQDLLGDLLPLAFDALHTALRDSVDDVGAVAGGALSTAVDLMSSYYTDYALSVLETLCSIIPEQDDLTPAANTFVPLLAQLLLKPNISCLIKTEETVIELVQRLWSLLEHNNSSVRSAALQTFCCLPSQPLLTSWSTLLQPTLRHIFQRALVEHQLSIHKTVEVVWTKVLQKSQLSDILHAACPHISAWLCLAMQPARIPFDPNFLIQPKPLMKEPTAKHLKSITGVDCTSRANLKQYIGGTESLPQSTRESNASHTRYVAAKMIGVISTFIIQPAPGIDYSNNIESPIDCYVKVLLVHLESKSALQRFVTGLVITEWAKCECPSPTPTKLVEKLLQCLNENIYYDEIAMSYPRLLQDTKDYLALLKHYKLPEVDKLLNVDVLFLDQMDEILGTRVQQLLQNTKLKQKISDMLLERRKAIHNSVLTTLTEQNSLHIMTQASLASACLLLGQLPEKLTPIVKPLMESIKREENEELQALSAKHLACLMEKTVNRNPCPNAKIITNLCTFLRVDPEFTPVIPNIQVNLNKNVENQQNDHVYSGIIALTKQQKQAERAVLRRSNSTNARGRPSLHDLQIEEIMAVEDQTLKHCRIQRRGCKLALESIAEQFGDKLPNALPNLWQMINGSVKEIDTKTFDCEAYINNKEGAEHFISVLQVFEVTCPKLDTSLWPELFELLPPLICLLTHPYQAVRHMTSRCIATLATMDSVVIMTAVINQVVPMLSISTNCSKRQGAVEAIALILEKLQIQIVPFILFLIIPLLGRMSDQDENVRMLATHTFANLIQLMPLDGGIINSPQLPLSLSTIKEHQRQFLAQLFNPSTITDYEVPVNLNVKLRSYQKAGVNWLAFLNKYKLHGLLCDDMGLGKTVQSICILAGDHYHRRQKYKETKQEDCAPLPSLVVCPPTLTGHWVFEVEKFVPNKYLKVLHYTGSPCERRKMRSEVKKKNLIVASYDIVRKDIGFFCSIKWNYCILDEGHVIKNGKTKSCVAIKQINANHRIILSGTPIQNNVLELWSLFDFLMPGFLGTEKQFTARYSKPILASRDPKSSTKEQEAGVLAMEALHRQVLPFVLRRTKEDVLKDLPPKITQDYYCELSPIQRLLYEDFSKSQSHQFSDSSMPSSHVFQALRYMQSVCNHPKLALTPKHPQFQKIDEILKSQNSNLSDIKHACKFPALRQLLIECGIGIPNEQNNDIVVNQHRALIFCQLKAMLDILENDFFKVHMPTVSYLRLDGSVPPSLRHSVTRTFNNDPSIDALILTTQVGGLGLNLTGADTVIFIEHDWSPMKDLQAMDRAHRIGQNKVVNVYRLITRDTLEEKIMGLQKFKLMTANTVISSENASLQTMGTDKLLDLFSNSLNSNAAGNFSLTKKEGNSMKSILDTLPELWEHKDYEEEYDLSNFINNLQS